MATNIIEAVKGVLTPATLDRLGAVAGVAPALMRRFSDAGTPMLLGAMAERGSTPASAAALAGELKPGHAGPELLERLERGEVPGDGLRASGRGLMAMLFGQRGDALAGEAMALAGGEKAVGAGALALFAPVVLSVVGREAGAIRPDGATDPVALSNYLGGQRHAIAAAVPGELRGLFAAVPGLSFLAGSGAVPGGAAAAGGGLARLLPWLLLAAGALALLWYLFGRGERSVYTADVNATTVTCNEQFRAALAARAIEFETGSATITAGSRLLLDDLSGVAGRCSAFSIEVAGHTDVTGDTAANEALSDARARAVVAYLTGKGVPASQLAARGYGEALPIDRSGTAEGNQRNRRIEFVVR